MWAAGTEPEVAFPDSSRLSRYGSLSRLSVFAGWFPEIFGNYSRNRGERQAPTVLFASRSSAGMINPLHFFLLPSKSPSRILQFPRLSRVAVTPSTLELIKQIGIFH